MAGGMTMTVRFALALLLVPAEFETTTEYGPASAGCALERV